MVTLFELEASGDNFSFSLWGKGGGVTPLDGIGGTSRECFSEDGKLKGRVLDLRLLMDFFKSLF